MRREGYKNVKYDDFRVDNDDVNWCCEEGSEAFFEEINAREESVYAPKMIVGSYDMKDTCFRDDSQFSERAGVTHVILEPVFTALDGAIFDRCSDLEYVELSPEISIFPKMLFSSCSKLTTVIFPDKLRRIESLAFCECASLKRLELPGMLEFIGERAFEDSGLVELFVPDSVTHIGENAFCGCDGLIKLSIPEGLDISKAGLKDETRIERRVVGVKLGM